MSMAPPLWPEFVAARYLPAWLALGSLRAVTALPPRLRGLVGRLAGDGLRALMRERRGVAARNLELCFPDLDRRERSRLVRRHFRRLGMGLVETGLAWWGDAVWLTRHSAVEGLEDLDAALAGGRGAILLSAHFTSFELGLRLLSLRRPCHMSYRPHNNRMWEAVIRAGRLSHLERLVEHKDVDGMLASLRENRPLWYAPDQNYNKKHAVFVPFFAEPAATMTATAWLAGRSGAPVLPFSQHRLDDGPGWVVHIEPALAGFPSGDAVADARRVNAALEAQIRRAPDEYLWVHRRFKTRPPGMAPAYDRAQLRTRFRGADDAS